MREARPITTQNPSVGLYRFATAFPGHCEHVALQQQSFASAWPVAILHLEGFKTCAKHSRHKTPLWAFTALGFKMCAKHGPSGHKTPSVGLYRFATVFPGHCEHVALQRQPFASAWPCRHTPFRGFQNVREARPITTLNPSVGLYRFATAFPSHCEHVALQQQPFASAWSVAILHLEGFKRCAKHGPSRHKPLCGPLPLCHCLPRSLRTRCPAAAVLCQRLASRHTPFRGFQNITTQNPSVGLYRFATAFPGHCEHVALQQQSFASAWPVAILHLLADACSLPLLPFEWLNCVFVLSCQCTAPPRCARWRPPAN